MTAEQRPAPQYSALQLAWLQELGVEKPWLPVDMRAAGAAVVGAAVATAKVSPKSTMKAESSYLASVSASEANTDADTQVASEAAVPPSGLEAKASRVVAPTPPSASSRSSRQSGAAQAKGVRGGKPLTPIPVIQVDTQAAATAAVDLAALSETVSACQACGLCRERHQAVFGEGVMQPSIMVIGEAPAEQEDRQGKPFVDRMGLMLDNMLTSIQCSRTHNVYVSNIVKCRPPGNRNPKPDELAACKPYLLRQIALVRPFAIFAVGRVAARVLLETDAPLQKLRQLTHTLTVDGVNIPLIVSHHPASLLNHPADKASAWQDLQLIRTVSGL